MCKAIKFHYVAGRSRLSEFRFGVSKFCRFTAKRLLTSWSQARSKSTIHIHQMEKRNPIKFGNVEQIREKTTIKNLYIYRKTTNILSKAERYFPLSQSIIDK